MKNNKKYYLALVLIVLIASNPSYKSFREYCGIHEGHGNVRREANLLLFSVFSDKSNRDDYYYIAIMGNFIKVLTHFN